MNSAVTFEGTIRSLNSRQDKSASMSIVTGLEMSVTDFGYLRDIQGLQSRITIEPVKSDLLGNYSNDYDQLVEIQTRGALKSPSQRLRSTIYVALEQKLGRKPTPSEEHANYIDRMETIINNVKDELE